MYNIIEYFDLLFFLTLCVRLIYLYFLTRKLCILISMCCTLPNLSKKKEQNRST